MFCFLRCRPTVHLESFNPQFRIKFLQLTLTPSAFNLEFSLLIWSEVFLLIKPFRPRFLRLFLRLYLHKLSAEEILMYYQLLISLYVFTSSLHATANFRISSDHIFLLKFINRTFLIKVNKIYLFKKRYKWKFWKIVLFIII